MDNDHGITGELRKWFKDRIFMANGWQEIRAIADRIDAEYERTMAAAALIAGVPMTDENMAEHGWVKLPVDAEGKPWNIGDFTESGQLVYKMYLDVHGWSFYGLVNDIDPSIHRHYHKPTVEDVLRELVDEWVMASSTEDEEAAIAECAKKLQLRGDEQ